MSGMSSLTVAFLRQMRSRTEIPFNPIDGPTAAHRWVIDGPSMGHRWDLSYGPTLL